MRLAAGLAPLQPMAVTGILSFDLAPKAGGTEMMPTSDVGGYLPGGTAQLAPAVDGVLAQRLARSKAFAEVPAR